MNGLELTPMTLREANAFVVAHHRNHKPVPGTKFAIGVSLRGVVVGVALVGRPVSYREDNGFTLEVNRCCTDGTRNTCSFLYGAAWRAARAMGYRRLITYTLKSEGGASLRASGWRLLGEAGGGNWNTVSRPRVDTQHQQLKLKWEAVA
tara:strand:- start:1591 stop:2037 length:447 start_codon:yes stop_codon:yes gene_type:complete